MISWPWIHKLNLPLVPLQLGCNALTNQDQLTAAYTIGPMSHYHWCPHIIKCLILTCYSNFGQWSKSALEPVIHWHWLGTFLNPKGCLGVPFRGCIFELMVIDSNSWQMHPPLFLTNLILSAKQKFCSNLVISINKRDKTKTNLSSCMGYNSSSLPGTQVNHQFDLSMILKRFWNVWKLK